MPPASQQQDYEFIVNPAPPPKRNLLAEASLAKRILLILGVLLILIIFFNVLRGILGGKSDAEQFISVAQEQQQLIQIATNASDQQGLSTIATNSAVTTKAGISSDQVATLAYMKKNGVKVKAKQLKATLSASIDEQLTASAEAGTYDQTYKSVMGQQLTAYARHLQTTYKHTSGKKGHQLLTDNYRSAQLLLQQLQTP